MLEPISALIGALVTPVATHVWYRVVDHITDRILGIFDERQQPLFAKLERDMSEGQRREIEAHYKSGVAFLDDGRRTNKRRQKIQFINNARIEFTRARYLYEVGEMAARAALLVGACHHLLYRIDTKNGTANEQHWYDDAFQLAEQSKGPDGKPPHELIQELLRLPYLSRKYGTFEVYWQKWDPPKRIEAPPKRLLPPLSSQSPRRQIPDLTLLSCARCGKDFFAPSTQILGRYLCPECERECLSIHPWHPWLK